MTRSDANETETRDRIDTNIRAEKPQNPPDDAHDDSDQDDEDSDGQDAADAQNESDQQARKKRRPLVLIIAIVVVALLVLGGIYYWLSGLNVEATDDAYTDGRAVQIAPQVAGRVVSLDVTDNQFVRRGQALIHIDPRQFINDRDQQQGTLDTAKAQLAGQRLSAEVAKKNFPAALQSAQADLASAQANLSRRQADFARQKSLPKQATTQQEVDSATASLQQAQAQVLQAQARVVQAEPVQQQIGESEAQVRQLAGQGEQAQAKLTQANLNLSYTVVKAPQDGWITKRNVEQGNYISAGQQIFSIVSPEVWVTANFKETQLNLMRPGQSVHITVDAYPELDLHGHVDSIQLGSGSKFSAFPAENATGNFVKIVQRVPVKIVIDSGLDPTLPLPPWPVRRADGHGAMSAAGAAKGKASNAQADSVNGWKPSYNPWLIAVSVTLAAFMEILDTTIVNVALPHIAGTLAASSDEATYALTSYLVANGIVLTVSGWLSDTIGRKRYFIICLGMFTVCSFLCGISQSLGQLIIFRLMQGFFGGGLQPNQQAIILDTFPPAKRGAAFGLTAVATIVAPVLGPTLGGWITDTYSWRWIFWVNVPVGIFAVVLNMILVEDPPWEKAKRKRKTRGIDYIGLSLISIGLGCFQVMMDKGEDWNWFGSIYIRVLALLAFLGIFGAIAWLLTAKKPIVNLDVFKDKNFAMGCVFIAAMGMILYASSVVIPQFAQQELGYTATISGLILSPGGIVVIVLIPIVGLIMKRVQTRYIVMFGFFVMGCALFFSSGLVPNIDFGTLVLMRSAQTAALGFLFVPISTIAYLTLPMRLRSDGAALFSMFRNVFGSIGISLSTAMITERTQADQAQLSKFMTPFHQPYNTYIADAEQTFRNLGRAASTVHQAAVAQIYQTYMKQAAVLAYSNVSLSISRSWHFVVVPFCLPDIREEGDSFGRRWRALNDESQTLCYHALAFSVGVRRLRAAPPSDPTSRRQARYLRPPIVGRSSTPANAVRLRPLPSPADTTSAPTDAEWWTHLP